MIDYEKLKKNLENLTGRDFVEAERESRNAGDTMPLITFSTGFQIRLAAKALDTNARELENLPINQYNKIATTVSNFLFSDSESEKEESSHATLSTK